MRQNRKRKTNPRECAARTENHLKLHVVLHIMKIDVLCCLIASFRLILKTKKLNSSSHFHFNENNFFSLECYCNSACCHLVAYTSHSAGVKALANEDTLLRTHCCGHIVADTNVSPFTRARNICCDTNFVSVTKVSQFAQHENTTFILCPARLRAQETS